MCIEIKRNRKYPEENDFYESGDLYSLWEVKEKKRSYSVVVLRQLKPFLISKFIGAREIEEVEEEKTRLESAFHFHFVCSVKKEVRAYLKKAHTYSFFAIVKEFFGSFGKTLRHKECVTVRHMQRHPEWHNITFFFEGKNYTIKEALSNRQELFFRKNVSDQILSKILD